MSNNYPIGEISTQNHTMLRKHKVYDEFGDIDPNAFQEGNRSEEVHTPERDCTHPI